jgi:Protein of unknown function (DUF3325)
LLNALTTDVHLARTIAADDGLRAGFDIAMGLLAAMFAWASWKVRSRVEPRPRGGALLLALSAAVCIRAHGIGVGLVLWCGLLTAAGLVVAWLLAYRARWLPSLGGGALVCAAVSLVAVPTG